MRFGFLANQSHYIAATLIAVQLVLYAWLTWLSGCFSYDSHGPDRPLLTVLGVFGALFAIYLISIPVALRVSNQRRWLIVLFSASVVFRLIVLFSEPIQEVDLYRYLWDGAVTDQGINPYQYSPAEIRDALGSENDDPNIAKLVGLVESDDGLSRVLERVHFAELPTVYPPVSQLVFRLVHCVTPNDSSVSTRVRLMKLAIVTFDIGIIILLFKLLIALEKNPGWFVAYAWSPLTIKEFANSGHLDAIVVLLVTASIVSIVHCRSSVRGHVRTSNSDHLRSVSCSFVQVGFSAILMGLAVGAKLYPLIFFPVLAVYTAKRFGINRAILWCLLAVISAAVSLAPMTMTGRPTKQLEGLSAFMSRWEINDLIFMIVVENMRPEGSVAERPPLWFTVTPDHWRVDVTQKISLMVDIEPEQTPFFVARTITTLIFLAIVLWLCRCVYNDPEQLVAACFLTVAWFWLLSPTQNPWYWTWALPLVAFARNRVWLLVSGLAMVYYSRFWFQYHPKFVVDWMPTYSGVHFYDFVMVWIVFGSFLLGLGGNWLILRHSPMCDFEEEK